MLLTTGIENGTKQHRGHSGDTHYPGDTQGTLITQGTLRGHSGDTQGIVEYYKCINIIINIFP